MIDDYVHPLSINGQLMKKDARIAELEAALRPFADFCETNTCKEDKDDTVLCGFVHFLRVAHLRAARAALEKTND